MGSNTIQSGRSQDAARIAAEVAARQAAETARHEALKQTLQKPVPLSRPTLVKDGFEPMRARGGVDLYGGTPTPTAPVGGTGVAATRTFDTPEALADHLASSPRPVDLSNAVFNFPVDMTPGGALFTALESRLPAGTRLDTVLLGANLSGATFHGGLTGVDLIGANLAGACFEGPVERTSFLYANLSGADFSGSTGVRDADFAFSDITGMNLPASVDTTGSVFTGTPRGTEPLLDPNLQLNDPALLSSITGTTDPVEQQRLVREWEADGTLFNRLDAALPPGTLDGLMPPEWRSRLYDELHSTRAADDVHFELKARIFDAVDGRYGPYSRSPSGPTLRDLYTSAASDGSQHLQGFINGALADMLLSDVPVSLTQPYGGGAPPFASGELTRLAREVESAPVAGGAAPLDAWLDRTFVYNAQPFAVRNTNLDGGAVNEARAWLQANRPDLVDDFNAMAENGLLTPQHLLDAGMRDVVQHLFDRHYTP